LTFNINSQEIIVLTVCFLWQCLTAAALANAIALDGDGFDTEEFNRASVVLLYFLTNGDSDCEIGSNYTAYLQWLMGNDNLYGSVAAIFGKLTRDDKRSGIASKTGVSGGWGEA